MPDDDGPPRSLRHYATPITKALHAYVAQEREHAAATGRHVALAHALITSYREWRVAVDAFLAVRSLRTDDERRQRARAAVDAAAQALDAAERELAAARLQDLIDFVQDVECGGLDTDLVNAEADSHPKHPLADADEAAKAFNSGYWRDSETELLINHALAKLRAANARSAHLGGVAKSIPLLEGDLEVFALYPPAPADEAPMSADRRETRARYKLIAALARVVQPWSASEIAEIMTTRYGIDTTDDQVNTAIRNMQRDDAKRDRADRVLPATRAQAPGKRKGR